jgi:tetratricopeptide (TPR) repeat protein
VQILELAVRAWTALAEGKNEEALRQMRSAAELEDWTEKSAVTPGPLAPARELLGEMLLQMNEPAQALEQFEAMLKKEPGRFRALYGAARAAQRGLSANREDVEAIVEIHAKRSSPAAETGGHTSVSEGVRGSMREPHEQADRSHPRRGHGSVDPA